MYHLFTAIITFFIGFNIFPQPADTTSYFPAPQSASVTAVPSPTPRKLIFLPTPTTTPKPSAVTPSLTPPQNAVVPSTTSVPTVMPTPLISKSIQLRPGAANCSPSPSGEVTVTITKYDEKDNITDLTIKGSANGLSPNTRYFLDIGSSKPLGGPTINTDGDGNANLDFQIRYTVKYDELYSISISDPDKLYPDNSCLLGDLKDGLG